MSQLLERYGLGGLAPWLSGHIVNGTPIEEIELELYDRPEFINRFPAIRIRGRDGKPPLSVEEYLAYENSSRAMAKSFGVDITQEEINGSLVEEVSVQELQERFTIASKAVYQTDAATRQELQERYGIGIGDLTRYWLDPKKELPALQRRFVQADIAGTAVRTGYNRELSEDNLGTLYDRGVTAENAGQGFATLVQAEQLFGSADDTENDITVEDQLSLLTGDANVAGEVEKRGQKRAAKFQEGGGFSTGNTGVAGLGKAST
jgi:hypothetical protein